MSPGCRHCRRCRRCRGTVGALSGHCRLHCRMTVIIILSVVSDNCLDTVEHCRSIKTAHMIQHCRLLSVHCRHNVGTVGAVGTVHCRSSLYLTVGVEPWLSALSGHCRGTVGALSELSISQCRSSLKSSMHLTTLCLSDVGCNSFQ